MASRRLSVESHYTNSFLMRIMPDGSFTNGANVLVLEHGKIWPIPPLLDGMISKMSKGDEILISRKEGTQWLNGIGWRKELFVKVPIIFCVDKSSL